ncbi:MAG: hypothetical protein RR806_07465 [Oscillospiraceae bacterium]
MTDEFRYNTEEMVLEMADLVRESRYLRKENERLKNIETQYRELIHQRMVDSEEHSKAMLEMAFIISDADTKLEVVR